jgi:hypothetical protein
MVLVGIFWAGGLILASAKPSSVPPKPKNNNDWYFPSD